MTVSFHAQLVSSTINKMTIDGRFVTVMTLLISGMLNVIIISNEIQAWNLGMARTYEP